MRVRGMKLAAAGLATLLACSNVATLAWAKDKDDGNAAAAGDSDNPPAKKAAPKGAKDPVAAAFKLPSGTTLNSKQKAAYEALKGAKEDELRQAMDDVQNAQGSAATAQAIKKVKELRSEIHDAIDQIVNGQVPSSTGGPASSGGAYQANYVPYTAAYGYGGGYGYYPPYGYYRNAGYPYYYPRGKYPTYGGKSPPRPSPRPAPSARH